jgi:hypothetical protein
MQQGMHVFIRQFYACVFVVLQYRYYSLVLTERQPPLDIKIDKWIVFQQ